ncbi:P-loop containing nucleoside triphosphate hydrolase protein [Aspergillus karnatakaensis]|uniref:GTPase domain-containing protein n=1 Tax=Aspergillus karnatakaensis TaxID=1810916 RepID=UPI003CCD99B7
MSFIRKSERVIVILVLGPTGAGKTNFIKLLTGQDIPVWEKLASGTLKSCAVLEELDDRMFLFIDTPGFGHSDLPNREVESAIYDLLGNFTRWLGGIYGIVYVDDIRTERQTSGKRDSFRFLYDLVHNTCPLLTLVTTHWDCIAPKERARCDAREEELKDLWREKFNMHEGLFLRCEASASEDDLDYLTERARLMARITNIYSAPAVELTPLAMPFSDWSWGQAGMYAVEVIGDASLAILKATNGVHIILHLG